MAEAEAFLIGCFLGTFPGKDVKEIRKEIALGKYDEVFADEAIALVEREHLDYARRRGSERQVSATLDESADVGNAADEQPPNSSSADDGEQ